MISLKERSMGDALYIGSHWRGGVVVVVSFESKNASLKYPL